MTREDVERAAAEWGRFQEQVELGARALFELERSTPLGRFAFPEGDWLAASPVEQDRFRRQARAVLKAAIPR